MSPHVKQPSVRSHIIAVLLPSDNCIHFKFHGSKLQVLHDGSMWSSQNIEPEICSGNCDTKHLKKDLSKMCIIYITVEYCHLVEEHNHILICFNWCDKVPLLPLIKRFPWFHFSYTSEVTVIRFNSFCGCCWVYSTRRDAGKKTKTKQKQKKWNAVWVNDAHFTSALRHVKYTLTE